VELRVESKHLRLCYADNAPPFDPRSIQATPPADVSAELDERRVGGLGVLLMLQMAHSLDYAYVEGFNRLQLVLKREP
jgi:anti-sigma regulatory factor (Ser/Thr protein kinase)